MVEWINSCVYYLHSIMIMHGIHTSYIALSIFLTNKKVDHIQGMFKGPNEASFKISEIAKSLGFRQLTQMSSVQTTFEWYSRCWRNIGITQNRGPLLDFTKNGGESSLRGWVGLTHVNFTLFFFYPAGKKGACKSYD